MRKQFLAVMIIFGYFATTTVAFGQQTAEERTLDSLARENAAIKATRDNLLVVVRESAHIFLESHTLEDLRAKVGLSLDALPRSIELLQLTDGEVIYVGVPEVALKRSRGKIIALVVEGKEFPLAQPFKAGKLHECTVKVLRVEASATIRVMEAEVVQRYKPRWKMVHRLSGDLD